MQFYSDFEAVQTIFLYLSLTFASHFPHKLLATNPTPVNLMAALGVFSTLGPQHTSGGLHAPAPPHVTSPDGQKDKLVTPPNLLYPHTPSFIRNCRDRAE